MWLSILFVLILGAWAWGAWCRQPRPDTKKSKKPCSLYHQARLLEESKALLQELKKLNAAIQKSHPNSIRQRGIKETAVAGSAQQAPGPMASEMECCT